MVMKFGKNLNKNLFTHHLKPHENNKVDKALTKFCGFNRQIKSECDSLVSCTVLFKRIII